VSGHGKICAGTADSAGSVRWGHGCAASHNPEVDTRASRFADPVQAAVRGSDLRRPRPDAARSASFPRGVLRAGVANRDQSILTKLDRLPSRTIIAACWPFWPGCSRTSVRLRNSPARHTAVTGPSNRTPRFGDVGHVIRPVGKRVEQWWFEPAGSRGGRSPGSRHRVPQPGPVGHAGAMDESAGQKRTRRRRRRRHRTSGQKAPESAGAETAVPIPTPTRRASPVRKPRGTPNPDRAGISASMAMRAREVSRPDG
jgi:hypothetical protein